MTIQRSVQEIAMAIAYVEAMAKEAAADPDKTRGNLVSLAGRRMADVLRWVIGADDRGFGDLLKRALSRLDRTQHKHAPPVPKGRKRKNKNKLVPTPTPAPEARR